MEPEDNKFNQGYQGPVDSPNLSSPQINTSVNVVPSPALEQPVVPFESIETPAPVMQPQPVAPQIEQPVKPFVRQFKPSMAEVRRPVMQPADDSLNQRYEGSVYDSSLELPAAGMTSAAMTPVAAAQFTPIQRFSAFKFNRTAFMITLATISFIVLVGVGSFFISHKTTKSNVATTQSSSLPTDKYSVGNLPLQGLKSAADLQIDSVNHLAVNGQLEVNNTLVLAPTATPNTPVTGQIYYDQTTNQPYYYNGAKFISLDPTHVTSIGAAEGVISLGQGLQINGNQLAVSSSLLQSIANAGLGNPTVSSLQGLTGNVTLSSGSGIAISGTTITNTGVVSLASSDSSVSITNNGSGAYNIRENNTAGTGINITGNTITNAGVVSLSSSDATITIVANGNGAYDIKSVPSGGSAAIALAPATIQADTSNLSTIHINKTGTGNFLEFANSGVNTFVVDQAGQITTGSIDYSQVLNKPTSLVSSIGGLTGAVATGTGLSVSGNTISNSGVTSLTGTNNQISVSAATGTVTLTLPQSINSTATPTFSGEHLGLANATSGSLIFANSSNAHLTTLQGQSAGSQDQTITLPASTAATDTVCLQTLANCSGAGNSVTTSGGTTNTIPKFSSAQAVTNSSITDNGTTVTVGNILSAATFTASLIQSTGALTITPSGNLTIGSTNQPTAIQGNGSSTFSATASGFTSTLGFTAPTASRTINLPNASGTVCLQNSASCGFALGGSGVTTLNGLAGVLSIANATGSSTTVTINDASTTQKGIAQFNSSDFTANLGVIDTVQAITTTSALQFASLGLGTTSTAGNLTLGASGTLVANTLTHTGTGHDISIDAGANNVSFSNSSGANTFLFPTTGGTGQVICTSGITCASGGGQAVILEPGTVQTSNSNLDSIFINRASGSGNLLKLQAGGLNALVINSTGDTTISNTTTISALQTNSITPTAALTIGATTKTFTLQGDLSSQLSATDPSTYTTNIAFSRKAPYTAPTGNVTYNFENDSNTAPGSYYVCTTVGNCAGVGGSVTTTGGTAGTVAMFTSSGNIADSLVTQASTTVTVGGNLAVGVSNSGLTNYGLIFNNHTNSNTVTLQLSGAPSSNATIAVPNVSGTVAVSAAGPLSLDATTGALTCPSCLTSGGGGGTSGVTSVEGLNGVITLNNTTAAGSAITIDNASTTVKGIAQFNSTNFSASSGVINTAQDIAVASSPTFANLTVQGTTGLTVGSSANLGQLIFKDGTADGFASTFSSATMTASHLLTIPNASGTLAVSASGNLALSAIGNLTISNNPSFTTSVTTPAILSTGNLSLDANGANSLSINGTGTGDILLGGGSGSTGCTITNASGALACSGTINSATISGGSLSATAVNGLSVASGTITSPTVTGTVTGSSTPNITGFGTYNTATISGGSLTGSAVNSLNVSGTAISGTGSLSIDANGANNLSLNGTGTGDILLGGGSGSTGCTITNASGALACSSNINSVGGAFQLNGVQISSAALSNDSNLAKLNSNQTFSGNDTFSAASDALILSGVPTGSATASVIRLGAAISGGSGSGTYLGANPASFSGDFINLQVGNSSVFKVSNSGAVTTGSTINNASISGGSLSGGSVSGGSLTASAVNTLNVSGTAISGTGTLSVDANGSSNLLLGGVGTGDILLGGGSGSTGCTITNATGALACSAGLQGTTLTSTAANGLTLGTSSSNTGGIIFKGSGGTGTLTVAGPTTPNAGNFTLSLPAITANANICTDNIICSGYASGSGSGAYIQNQIAGQQASSNFWISGSGRADVSILTPTIDVASAAALNIGTTTASSINIGKTASNIATTINGTAIVKPTTGNDSTTAFQVQNAAAVSILNIDTTSGSVTIKTPTNNTNALVVQNTGSTPVFTVDTTTGAQQTILQSASTDATLGSELYPTSNFATDFGTTTGWDVSTPTQATHTAGNTNTITNTTVAITAANVYQVGFTLSGACGTSSDTLTATIGGVTLSGGAITGTNCSGAYSYVVTAANTNKLAFTPTTSWTGTVKLVTIKQITNPGRAVLNVKNSLGVTTLEVRSSGSLTNNTFVGLNSGTYNTSSGTSNTALGSNALQSNTNGFGNTAIGTYALLSNTTATNSTAVGAYALSLNTTGTSNTAVGANSLKSNTTGSASTAVGQYALLSNTTGTQNVALGLQALQFNVTGSYNTALGTGALSQNSTGSFITATGQQALERLKTLTGTISATVNNSARAQFTSTSTTGLVAGATVTISGTTNYNGSRTIYSVDDATHFTITAGYTTADSAGAWTTGSTDGTTAYGYTAGQGSSFGYTAVGGTYVGYQAGVALQTGANYNSLLGYNAGSGITIGIENSAIGANALSSNTSGNYNSAFGVLTLLNNNTGSNNSAYGNGSLFNLKNLTGTISATVSGTGSKARFTSTSTTGLVAGAVVTISGTTSYNGGTTIISVDDTTHFTINQAYSTADSSGSWTTNSPNSNTAVGYSSGVGTTAYSAEGNSLFGYQTGQSLQTGANYNTLVGYSAGQGITTGARNVLLGVNAGIGLTIGSNNVGIGQNVAFTSNTGSNQLQIGSGISGDLSLGTLAVKTGANSTNGFQVLNSSSVSVLNVDTSLQRTSIGSIGAGTGQLYVSGMLPSATLGSVATGTNPYYFAVQGKYAYVVNNGSNTLRIVDISVPSSPAAISSVATYTSPYAVVVSGKYAYVTNNGDASHGLQIFDISNPTSPVSVGTVATGNGPRTLAVQGRYVFLLDATDATIQSFDVSNPAAPVALTTQSTGTNPVNISVGGRYAYVTNNSGPSFTIFDISNPSSIPAGTTTSTTTSGPNPIYVSGRYAYLVASNSSSAFQIWDISNPSSPSQTGSTTAGASPNGIYVQGRYAYVIYNGGNFQIFDISNPASPSSIGTYATGLTTPTGVVVSGRYAYVTTSTGLVSFDLGGTYDQQLEAGGIETGTLQVNNNANFNNSVSIAAGLQVGQSLQVSGDLGVAGATALNSLQVSGTLNVTGSSTLGTTSLSTTSITSTSSDASVGSELYPTNNFATDFGTTTGWNVGTSTQATHTAGNTNTITNTTVAITNGATYQVGFTLSGSCGTSSDALTVSIGSQAVSGSGFLGNNCSGAYKYVVTASSTNKLSFAPSTSWAGTISAVSIKQISSIVNAALSVKNSGSTITLEVRSSGSTSNTFIGLNSGKYNATGNSNTAVGSGALQSNTGGYDNTALGYVSLSLNSTGHDNTALGMYALQYNSTGSNNTAIGSSALLSNSTGTGNLAIGISALGSNITGNNNTAIGLQALNSNTTGYQNIAIGHQALSQTTTSYDNIAIGYTSQLRSTGNQNNSLGNQSLMNNSTGTDNNAFGFGSLFNNTSGTDNIAIGTNVLVNSTNGNYNSAIGSGALKNLKDLGTNSLTATSNNGGKAQFTTSTTVGLYVGSIISISGTTSYNGSKTVLTVDSGSTFTINTAYSTADSSGTWASTTSNNYNTANGYNAGIGNGSNYYSAQGNSLFGAYAGYFLQTGANYNTLVGFSAGSGITTGYQNVILGASAGTSLSTGANNLLLGSNAGTALTTGSNNVGIGQGVVFASATGSNQLQIGSGISGDLALGTLTLKTVTNSTTGFAIQNTSAASVFNVDTATASTNLITNGGFETNTTGWVQKGTATLSQSSAQSYAGANSMSVVQTTVNSGAQFAYTLSANTTYTLNMYLKSASSSATIAIGRQDVSGSDISCLTGQSISSTVWKRFTCTFTTGGTITSSNIYVFDATATSTFYVDEVTLVAGTAPFSYGQFSINGNITTPTTFKNQSDSNASLQVQNASGSTIISVDTAGAQLVIGSSNPGGSVNGQLKIMNSTNTNAITISSGVTSASYGLTLPTAAAATGGYCLGTDSSSVSTTVWIKCPKSKKVMLTAEYAGAVLDAGTGANNSGTITSAIDLTNRENYYKWVTTQATSQSYDVDIQIPIPSDYANTPAISFDTYTTDTTNGTLQAEIRDNTGAVESTCNFASITPSSANAWQNKTCTISGSYAAGGYLTARIRMYATSAVTSVRVGNVAFTYNTY